jgi:hypothetical protein
MKLTEMSTRNAKQVNKVMESRFGFTIDYDKLTVEKAERLSETVTDNLDRIRHSHDIHTAEKNPRYMELLTVAEGLNLWLDENRDLSEQVETVEIEDVITESEVETASVILAAKDMVDTVQDMLEKVGEMQNEQLPSLYDTTRTELGDEKAEAYKNTVAMALEGLMTATQDARTNLDNASRALAGESVPDMTLPEPENDLDVDLAPELDAEDPTDDFGATDAAVGGSADLGREKR